MGKTNGAAGRSPPSDSSSPSRASLAARLPTTSSPASRSPTSGSRGTQRIEAGDGAVLHAAGGRRSLLGGSRRQVPEEPLRPPALFADVTFHREGQRPGGGRRRESDHQPAGLRGQQSHQRRVPRCRGSSCGPRNRPTPRRGSRADAKRIVDIYRRSGRFAATVEPKVIKLDQNRVDLVFEIHEGGRDQGGAHSTSSANRVFSDGRSCARRSRRGRAPGTAFFSSSDTYDPDRLTVRPRIAAQLLPQGGFTPIFRGRLGGGGAVAQPRRLLHHLHGGGGRALQVRQDRHHHDAEEPRSGGRCAAISRPTRATGTTPRRSNGASATITDALGNLGFAFVDVRPRIDRDRDKKVISLTYEIQEGPRVYVNRINITGNTRGRSTRSSGASSALVEGDAYNTSKLRPHPAAHPEPRVLQQGRHQERPERQARTRPTSTSRSRSSRPARSPSVSAIRPARGPLGSVGISEHNLLGAGNGPAARFHAVPASSRRSI